jgi:hypothetical protein
VLLTLYGGTCAICEALYNKASSRADSRHIFSPFNMPPVLIGFSICFSVRLLLSAVLIYRDVKLRRSNSINGINGMNGMNKNLESL